MTFKDCSRRHFLMFSWWPFKSTCGTSLPRQAEGRVYRAIYAVFHGRSFKDIARDARNGINHPDGGQFIYVFSLAGKPLMRYVLDHYICGISVDEQRGVIYATDVNEDEPILEYSIKTI